MDLTDFLRDDDSRAVSPVIGVILMVSITVILAAVIGTFVLGLGDQVQETSPNAQWDWDYSSSEANLTVSHQSGDSIDSDRLEITVSGGFEEDNAGDGLRHSDTVLLFDGDLSAGSSGTINHTDGNGGSATDIEGQTVRVIWTSEDGGSSSTLTSYDVPE